MKSVLPLLTLLTTALCGDHHVFKLEKTPANQGVYYYDNITMFQEDNFVYTIPVEIGTP